MRIDIYNTDYRYGLIYTDPPWQQKKGGYRKSRPNQGRNLDYKTCDLDQIKMIHLTCSMLGELKHNVFMWTIDKYLYDAEQMMKKIGYELHARFIWDKGNGVAPAFTVRFSHEYLLWFYRKGNMLLPVRTARGRFTTVIHEASTTHSKKPIAAYEMLERMFPESRKLELFARNHRDGWDCWGNEC